MNKRYQVIEQSGQRVVFEGTKEEAFAVKRYSNSYGVASDFYVRPEANKRCLGGKDEK